MIYFDYKYTYEYNKLTDDGVSGIDNLLDLVKILNEVDTKENIELTITSNTSIFKTGTFKYFTKDNKELITKKIDFNNIHYYKNSPIKIIGHFDDEAHKYLIDIWITYNEQF